MDPLTFQSLVRYHVATEACPLPPPQPGITWIWARNGLWKRGVGYGLDLLVPYGATVETPGLTRLLPYVRFADLRGQRMPGQLLRPILDHARQVSQGGLQPIEQQYFITWREDTPEKPLRVSLPQQQASAGSVRYQMPRRGRVLVDIHSHHTMPAYFSQTDDYDDTGLSVSCVIGNLFKQPEILCRLNVHGQRWQVPASLVFTDSGPFEDALHSPRGEVLCSRS